MGPASLWSEAGRQRKRGAVGEEPMRGGQAIKGAGCELLRPAQEVCRREGGNRDRGSLPGGFLCGELEGRTDGAPTHRIPVPTSGISGQGTAACAQAAGGGRVGCEFR